MGSTAPVLTSVVTECIAVMLMRHGSATAEGYDRGRIGSASLCCRKNGVTRVNDEAQKSIGTHAEEMQQMVESHTSMDE